MGPTLSGDSTAEGPDGQERGEQNDRRPQRGHPRGVVNRGIHHVGNRGERAPAGVVQRGAEEILLHARAPPSFQRCRSRARSPGRSIPPGLRARDARQRLHVLSSVPQDHRGDVVALGRAAGELAHIGKERFEQLTRLDGLVALDARRRFGFRRTRRRSQTSPLRRHR